MSALISTIFALLFLVVGGITFVIMMAKFGGWHFRFLNADRAAHLHRVLGWIYSALYLTVFAGMVIRVTEYWELWPAHVAIHVTLAFALFFLLALKVSIPRYFPAFAKHLLLLGVTL